MKRLLCIIFLALLAQQAPAQTAQMLYAEGLDITASTTDWVNVCAISSGSFTAGKKYLILAVAHASAGSVADEVRLRLVHGATPTIFDDATMAYDDPGLGGTNYETIGYMTVFEQPGSAEAVTLQISNSSTFTSTARLGQIFAMKLSDDFTENADWFYDEVTADYTTTNAFSDTDNTEAAAVTFTPNGTDDYLVIGNFYLTPVSELDNYAGSLYNSVENTDEPVIDMEGEDTTNEKRSHLIVRTYTPSNASQTFQMRFMHETNAHTIMSSRIFALRLNKFSQHAFVYNAAELAPTTSMATINTLGPTPTTTGNWFVLGSFGNDVAATNSNIHTRLQIDADGGGLASDPNKNNATPQLNGWDATDVKPYQIFKMKQFTSGGARTINLDFMYSSNGESMRAEHRNIVAFSAALTGGAAPPARRMQKPIFW